MTVDLYGYYKEKNRIDKTAFLGAAQTLNVTLKKETDELNPILLVQSIVPLYYTLYNYAYIPDFQRWYFVTNSKMITTNLTELYLHIDVLYTYRAEILSSPCIISRSENQRTKDLVDDRILATKDKFIGRIKSSLDPFDPGIFLGMNYVLTVAATVEEEEGE